MLDRILTYFDLMNDKFDGQPIRLQMNRENFATYLNVGSSSLYRELLALQREGIISIDQNHIIRLTKWKTAAAPHR